MSRLGGVQLQILELDDVARLRHPSTPVTNQNFHMTALFEVWTTGVLSFYTHTYTHTRIFPSDRRIVSEMDKRIPEADEIRYVDVPPALSMDVTIQKVRINFGANLVMVANIAESGRAGLRSTLAIFLPTLFFFTP